MGALILSLAGKDIIQALMKVNGKIVCRLCGFMFIVAFTQDELQFERNKAISIINATLFPPVINSRELVLGPD